MMQRGCRIVPEDDDEARGVYDSDDDDDEDDYDDDYDDYGDENGRHRATAQPAAPPPRFSAPLTRPGELQQQPQPTSNGGGGWGWGSAQQRLQQPQQQAPPSLAQQQLQEAIRSRCDRPEELLDRLLSGGGGGALDLNAPLKDGWSALMLAAERGHAGMVAALMRRGARVDFVASDGATALMAACGNRRCEEADVLRVVQLLLDSGAGDTLHSVAARSGTALHLAARANFPAVIARLLAAGAFADCPAGVEARTPLMEAALRGNLRAAEALLTGPDAAAAAAAARDRRDRRGHTAAELAANCGFARVARLIDAPSGQLAAALAAGGDGEGEGDGDEGGKRAEARWDELTSFFTGVGYPEVEHLFRAHDLTFVDLLTVTEATLERLGVKKVGARQRILEAVRQFHRRPWRDSSMPQLASGRPPTPGDYLAILANAHKHLEVMNATLRYLAEHADAEAADVAADAAAAAAGAASSDSAAAAPTAVGAAVSTGPTDGLRNPRVLARARNSCRQAAGECRRMLGRLEATLAALNRLQPAPRPDQLLPGAAPVTAPPKRIVPFAVGSAVIVAAAAAAAAAFLIGRQRF